MEHGTPMTEETLVCERPSDDVTAAADGADAPTNATAAELTLGFALDTGCMLVFGRMAAPPRRRPRLALLTAGAVPPARGAVSPGRLRPSGKKA